MSLRQSKLDEENSALLFQINNGTYTKAEVDALIKLSIITPSLMAGNNGFVLAAFYGPIYTVVWSDVNAGVLANYYVKDGGDFKVMLMYATSTGSGNTAGGKISINYDVDGGTQTWNVNGANFDIPVGAVANTIYYETYDTPFTVADNSNVAMLWEKDDNAGGVGGNIRLSQIVLVRQ